MLEANKIPIAYIRHIMERTGLAASALAKEAKMATTTLTRPLNEDEYPFAISNSTIRKLEAFSGIQMVQFLAGYSTDHIPVANVESQPRTKGQPVNFVPGEKVVLPGNRNRLPIFSGAEGGNGKLIVSSEFVDHMAMPAALEGVQGAYGIIVDGSSMNPEFWEGDIAWVNPHLKPARGRNHIFYHTPPGGEEAEAIIKRLNGWNDREWHLEQWKPAEQFIEPRRIWPICHRVVGKYEAP